ncbi:MAG TPA: hypothetical protein VLJ86_16595 [Ramlibacter sp.]|nr:hypothetical protein [Ramlibacter sp.]
MLKNSFAVCAVAALVAGCLGGGDDAPAAGGTTPPVGLKLSGTAAVGAALASAPVDVKCAAGGGTATTNASGAYELTLQDATLPCIISVTGTVNSATVVLHSVAPSGTGATAVANVTPLTEMIVAQLTGASPAEIFASFGAGTAISGQQLQTATATLLAALKTATGIDATAIDPFTAALVPVSSANATGNGYDQLLDSLGNKVTVESLPVVVAQIAAASSATTAGATPPTTLGDVMAGVDAGTMPNCPSVISGKYRTLDYWGRTRIRQIDFKALKFTSPDNVIDFDIAIDPAKPCEFVASGPVTVDSVDEQHSVKIVMGPEGAGAYNYTATNDTATRVTTGYVFPAQAHAYSSLVGDWTYVQSGYFPFDEGGGGEMENILGRLSLSGARVVTACEYDSLSNPTCQPDALPLGMTDRADGGFTLTQSGSDVAQMYAFRAPNGTLTVFATTNPDGARGTDVEQTHFVATRAAKLSLPAVNTVTPFWDAELRRSAPGVFATTLGDAGSNTVTAVDAATSTVTRTRSSDGRIDTVTYNSPIDGTRLRAAGTFNSVPFRGALQMPLPAGLTVSTDVDSDAHFFVISVRHP